MNKMEEENIMKLSDELDKLSIEERLCYYIDELGENLKDRWDDMDDDEFKEELENIKNYKGEKINNNPKWKQ
jgi:hypothetical protein